jgi:hypothetical protein
VDTPQAIDSRSAGLPHAVGSDSWLPQSRALWHSGWATTTPASWAATANRPAAKSANRRRRCRVHPMVLLAQVPVDMPGDASAVEQGRAEEESLACTAFDL